MVDRQRLDLGREMGERAERDLHPVRARRRRSSTARSGRSGTAARPRGSPCTGWSRCRCWRSGAGRTRRRASGRSARARCRAARPRRGRSRSPDAARRSAGPRRRPASSGSFLHRRFEHRRPVVELVAVGIGQRVLVERAAEPAADADVLPGLHEELGALHRGHLGPQALDDLARGHVALVMRLQLHEDARGVFGRVVGAGAGEGEDAGDVGILAARHRRSRCSDLGHRRERDVLARRRPGRR